MKYVVPPSDWRPWLGAMAILNFSGLLFYHFSRRIAFQYIGQRFLPKAWALRLNRFYLVLAGFLILTFVLQVWVYSKLGGLAGYIAAYEARDGSFIGMGWLFMLSESFPILAFMGYAVWASQRSNRSSLVLVIAILILYVAIQLLFGGLRGSRSNTIWAVFWAVGIIHFWLRPVSRQAIACGLAAMFVFMYLYGFYKSVGTDAIKVLRGTEARADLESESGRTAQGVILGDLGRSDIQAFLLYRLTDVHSDYKYALGQTYLSALALLIPDRIWPARPSGKIQAGTNAQYGYGTYESGSHKSSRIYALAGEAMLNFGVVAAPFAFLIFGCAVGSLRALMIRLHPTDTRWLIIPLMINITFSILVMDSGNIIFILVKNGALPSLLVMLSSSKLRVRSPIG